MVVLKSFGIKIYFEPLPNRLNNNKYCFHLSYLFMTWTLASAPHPALSSPSRLLKGGFWSLQMVPPTASPSVLVYSVRGLCHDLLTANLGEKREPWGFSLHSSLTFSSSVTFSGIKWYKRVGNCWLCQTHFQIFMQNILWRVDIFVAKMY